MGKRIRGDRGKCRDEGTSPGLLRIAHQDPWSRSDTALTLEVRGKGGNWQEWEIKGTSEASKPAPHRKATPCAQQSKERETRLGFAGRSNHGSWAVDRVLLHTPPGSSQSPLWFSEAPQVHGSPSLRPEADRAQRSHSPKTSNAYRSTEPRDYPLRVI